MADQFTILHSFFRSPTLSVVIEMPIEPLELATIVSLISSSVRVGQAARMSPLETLSNSETDSHSLSKGVSVGSPDGIWIGKRDDDIFIVVVVVPSSDTLQVHVRVLPHPAAINNKQAKKKWGVFIRVILRLKYEENPSPCYGPISSFNPKTRMLSARRPRGSSWHYLFLAFPWLFCEAPRGTSRFFRRRPTETFLRL